MLTRQVAEHLAVAVARHVRESRRSGMQIPDGVLQIGGIVSTWAMTGHDGPGFEQSPNMREPPVMERQLLTITEAATVLTCSVRTVKRMIASGHLRAVHPSPRSTRIKTDELRHFVANLNGDQHHGNDQH